MKNGTEVTLNLSSNVIADSSDETNFPHKLLLTGTQVSRLHKVLEIIHQSTYNYLKLCYLRQCS